MSTKQKLVSQLTGGIPSKKKEITSSKELLKVIGEPSNYLTDLKFAEKKGYTFDKTIYQLTQLNRGVGW